MTTNIDLGGNTLIVEGINVGATAPGQAGTSLSGTELTVIDGATAGTVVASKAVVVDTNKDTSSFRNLTATNLKAGASGTAGTVDIFPTTASKGKTEFTSADNSTNTTTTIAVAAQAGAVTYTVPDGGASASFVLSSGTSTKTTATSTELNTIAGVTAGTVIASKALVADSGIKISGLLNSTFGAGTATVAPINLTAGTNLTTAAAGAVEFDGNAFYATNRASARQQMDAEQYIIATANSATYNNTGLDTATAGPVFTSTTNSGISAGAVTLTAGKTYCFEFVYNLTNTGTTSHTWATLLAGGATFSTGSNYSVNGVSFGTASTPATGGLSGFIASTTLSTAVVVTAASTSATEQVTIQGFGTLVISGGGTVIPSLKASARPGASGTPGVVILAGSYFRVWEMGSSNFVGNWS